MKISDTIPEIQRNFCKNPDDKVEEDSSERTTFLRVPIFFTRNGNFKKTNQVHYSQIIQNFFKFQDIVETPSKIELILSAICEKNLFISYLKNFMTSLLKQFFFNYFIICIKQITVGSNQIIDVLQLSKIIE